MSLNTQRLTNNFPYHYKIRTDQSSFGARFLSSFSDMLDELNLSQQLLAQDFNIDTYSFNTLQSYTTLITPLERTLVDGRYTYVYPNIYGDDILLEHKLYMEDFFYNLSNELEITDTIELGNINIYVNDVLYDMPRPERLKIIIQNSTDYVQLNSSADVSQPRNHLVTLEGFDINYNLVKEHITVIDDGIYTSKYVYSKLTKVNSEGFDGEIIISLATTLSDYKISKYHTITMDDMQSRLIYYLEDDYLVIGGRNTAPGSQYRDDKVIAENFIEYARFRLYDINNDIISNCVDIAEFTFDGRFYLLTDTQVHVFNIVLPEFMPPPVNSSIEEYLLLENLISYVEINTEGKWMTRLLIDPNKMEWITIKCIAPDGTTEYLQNDRTWNATIAYLRPANVLDNMKWKDFQFTKTLSQTGQYNIVAELAIGKHTYLSVISSIVPILQVDYSTLHNVSSPIGLYENINKKLSVYNLDNIYDMNFVRNFYFIDETTGTVLTHIDYENIYAE